jgi:diguanylate cyclase (GGDEF)-like protein/PAS domain S-box-containing protein
MEKSGKGVWLFLLFLLLPSCSQPNQYREAPQAVDGVLDLQGWDFEKYGQTGLSGEWAFYWQELVSPDQIHSEPGFEYVSVPNNWTSYVVKGQSLPPEGYATYHLEFQLPDPTQVYGLLIEGEGTAYNLWVDGKLIAQNGSVATNSQEMIPQSKPQTVFFKPGGSTIELVIQISNWQHRKAGFRNEILLGSSSQIHAVQRNGWARDALIIGIYLVMGLYHLFIFSFRPANKGPLYFGIWCFLNLIRTGLLHQKLFVYVFPNMSWEFALHLEYLTFFFSTSIYAIFIQVLYPKDIHRWVIPIVFGIGLVFSIYMFLVETLTLIYVTTTYQIILLIELVYFIYFLGRILYRNRDGAVYIAIASLIGFGGVVLETFYLQNIISLPASSDITFLGFIFVQGILLSSRLSKSFHRVEVLSDELESKNTSLRESERKYRSIFEESKEMIFIAGLDEQIKDANPTSEELLGYTLDELKQMKMSDLIVHYQDREKIESNLRGREIVKDYDLELRRKNGKVIHGLVTLTIRRDENGRPTELHGNVHDISARIQAETERLRAMEFEQLSITDPLTNIYNRRIFDEIIIKEWERAKRSKSQLTIIIFDIDDFKRINDTHGHLIGDQVLTNLADLCLSNMRSMDIIARYGGEEFMILMPDTDPASAHQSMERLRITIAEKPLATSEDKEIFVTISAGIAIWNGQEQIEIPILLDHADQALYISKQTGRNKVTIWREA